MGMRCAPWRCGAVATLWRASILLALLCAARSGGATAAANSHVEKQQQNASAPSSRSPEQAAAACAAPGQCSDGATAAAADAASTDSALPPNDALETASTPAAGNASVAIDEGQPEQQQQQQTQPKATTDTATAGVVTDAPPGSREAATPGTPGPEGVHAGTDAGAAGEHPAGDAAAASEQPGVASAIDQLSVEGEKAAAEAEIAAPAASVEEALHDEQQHNFALAKDGAKVLAANKEVKKPNALLDDDSDTFLKNDCRADKWLMLELSQVAKVSRLELAQFELYSARVREFEVWGRQSHPRTDGFGSEYARTLNSTQWQLLGNFTAEKAKGSQLFAMDRPLWARYLLLRFLSQHGPEPVCAINGISVFGKSAVEELEDQLASASDEGLGLLDPELQPEPVAAAPVAVPVAAPAETAAGLTPSALPGVEAQASAAAAGTSVEAPAAPAGAGDAPARQQVQEPAPAAVPTDQRQHEQQQGAADGGVAAVNGSEAEPGSAAPASDAGAATVAPSAAPPDSDSDAPVVQQSSSAATVPDAGAGASGTNSSNGSTPAASEAAGSIAGEDMEQHATQSGSTNASSSAAAAAAVPTQESNGSAAGAATSEQPAPASDTGNATAPPAANASSVPQPQAQASAANGSSDDAGGTTAQPGSRVPASASAQPSQHQEPASASAAPSGKAAAPPAPPVASPGAAAPIEGLELPLVGLGAKAKGGGSVYDLLVQEIKTAKLQQKLLTKSVVELQRNASVQYAELTGDMASLAASLAKMPADHNVSDEELAARVDALVKAHLLHVSTQMLGLQAALASAAKQQHALLCFLAMMGGVLALNATRFSEQWPRAKWVVLLLAAANGLVGVALQLQGGMARHPFWMQAGVLGAQ